MDDLFPTNPFIATFENGSQVVQNCFLKERDYRWQKGYCIW